MDGPYPISYCPHCNKPKFVPLDIYNKKKNKWLVTKYNCLVWLGFFVLKDLLTVDFKFTNKRKKSISALISYDFWNF